MTECKYWKKEMLTILEYCKCLYKLDGCLCGGKLHILLDDYNYTDSDILFCLKECLLHPEEPESSIGILICHELLKLTLEERCLFFRMWAGLYFGCLYSECQDCITLELETGDSLFIK